MQPSIIFRPLKIPNAIYDVYYVIENGRSVVMDEFRKLQRDEQDLIKDLITKMATSRNFQSKKIRYNLKSYNYGEIKPSGHRFFFFQKCGNNYIFFDHRMKKSNSLPNQEYQRISKSKERYEQAFEAFIRRP